MPVGTETRKHLQKVPHVPNDSRACEFSSPYLSYGAIVLNILFWMHPTLNLKWWISLGFKPRHYSINKYSFSFSPSSSIFSSIMAEDTAVKALYPLMFISIWACGSLPNYEITEDWVWIFCSVCFLILCWVCFYSQNEPLPLPLWYMDKSFHWILLSCKNKNDPQMFKNYSGTIQCSICQSSQGSQSGRRLESMKKNPSLHKLSCCQRSWGKARSCDTLITERKSLQERE